MLLFDNGELYGTTSTGGSANLGTVFKLTQTKDKLAWTETVVHSFSGPAAGGDATPVAGLIENKGVFYGTTTFTIFKLHV